MQLESSNRPKKPSFLKTPLFCSCCFFHLERPGFLIRLFPVCTLRLDSDSLWKAFPTSPQCHFDAPMLCLTLLYPCALSVCPRVPQICAGQPSPGPQSARSRWRDAVTTDFLTCPALLAGREGPGCSHRAHSRIMSAEGGSNPASRWCTLSTAALCAMKGQKSKPVQEQTPDHPSIQNLATLTTSLLPPWSQHQLPLP